MGLERRVVLTIDCSPARPIMMLNRDCPVGWCPGWGYHTIPHHHPCRSQAGKWLQQATTEFISHGWRGHFSRGWDIGWTSYNKGQGINKAGAFLIHRRPPCLLRQHPCRTQQ